MPADNPQDAADDYNANVSRDKWEQGIQRAKRENKYAKGVAEFIGTSEGNVSQRANSWNDSTGDRAARNYESRTSNKGDDWAEAYVNAMEDA